MQTFNNVTTIVRDDLAKTITKGSRLSMAAACFSIYAFDALKKQLEPELFNGQRIDALESLP